MSQIVRKPQVFTDHFENAKENLRPAYWLEKNTEKDWLAVKNPDGGMMYGCAAQDKSTCTWLHVFETNVDIRVSLRATPAKNAKAIILARLSGEKGYVKAGYDFEQKKWYIEERMGGDFEIRTFYAPKETEFAPDAWHDVRVRVIEDAAEIICDGFLVLSVEGLLHVTTGRVGVKTENASLFMDSFSVALISGQGRVEKAPMANYMLSFNDEDFGEGASLFWYDDHLIIANLYNTIRLSEDQGQTFRKPTEEEEKKFAFFIQYKRTQYIRLHNGHILKVDNFTGGNAYLSTDNGMTGEKVGRLWPEEDLEKKWEFYLGMNDMLKEIRLKDGRYRVFYVGDARAFGNPEGEGKVIYHWEELYYTDDEGYTWHKSQMDSRRLSSLHHVCEARIIACDDGSLRMYSSWNESNCFRYYVSYDDGETWEGEYAIPQMRAPRGSYCPMADPTDPSTVYAAFVYCHMKSPGNAQYRTRLGLARTRDGKNWEYLMDCWRWDEKNNVLEGKTPLQQIVDPSITVTKDYVFVTSGWSEELGKHSYHNYLRQYVLKLKKADLTPYEEWPTYIPAPNEICHIEAIAPDKTEYCRGEKLDLTGGQVIVYYYDNTSAKISMDDPSVQVLEPALSINYMSAAFAPDMNEPGEKVLRVDYKNFSANITIHVK